MKLLLDADCLIKLTKAQAKELLCDAFQVSIPERVKQEAVDHASRLPDAKCIAENIDNKSLSVLSPEENHPSGDDALLSKFNHNDFDAVGTDDRRLIRRLRIMAIPFVTPGLCILLLLKHAKIGLGEAMRKLEELRPFISEDEFVTVRILLEKEGKT